LDKKQVLEVPGMLRLWVFAVVLLLSACATSPLGRSQLQFFPDQEMAQMGAAAYQDVRQKTPEVQNPAVREYVSCVANAITREVGEAGSGGWVVTVFKQDQANAFALPGGKIGVYSGLLDVAKNQDQLATVIGHEVAHVVAGHSNERVSTAYATQTGLEVIGALAGGSTQEKQQIMGLLGLGAQVGIILPFSRTQEREADLLGLDLMARAGFDPRASVQLWQNMEQQGGASAPEFLSTHPSHGSRIDELRDRMPRAMELYRQARAQGKSPDCGRP
jgi:predicted Zn-dependent protease